MAYTGATDTHVRTDGGGHMDDVDRGTMQFDGTATTLELPVQLEKIRPGSHLQKMPGTNAVTYLEDVWIAEAATSGIITVDSDGEITVVRHPETGGTGLSGLEVWYWLSGSSKDY